MACQTCNHTLQLVFMDAHRKVHHCPRCGTMRSELLGHVDDTVPALVERCRTFGGLLAVHLPHDPDCVALQWHRLGIAESIAPSEQRPLASAV